MNKFTAGLNTQIVRTSAGASYLAPTYDERATLALDNLGKVNAFIGHFKETNGFSKYHPSIIANTMTAAQSLVTGVSISGARGNGRVATVTDYILNNGCGMIRAAGAIEEMFGLDATWVIDERTRVCYPLVEGLLPKSSQLMKELDFVLSERAKFKHDRVIRKSTRDRLLLKNNWTDSRLIGYTIEWVSRAFAYQMDSEKRTELIKGDNRTSLRLLWIP